MAKARWDIRNVPEELDEWVRQMGEGRGECLRSTVLRLLWGLRSGKYPESIRMVSGSQGVTRRFEPPTPAEVEGYCMERGKGMDAQRFWSFYTGNGWMVGKNPMRDWRAMVVKWECDGMNSNGSGNGGAHGQQLNKAERIQRDNDRAVRNVIARLHRQGAGETGNGSS